MNSANSSGCVADFAKAKLPRPATFKRSMDAYEEFIPSIITSRDRGKTLTDIANMLNDAGHRTTRGSRFGPMTVSRILDLVGYTETYSRARA